MESYRVVFDLFEYMGEEGNSARETSSQTMNLETVVQAGSPTSAQRMVEAQYGGSNRVWVKSVQFLG